MYLLWHWALKHLKCPSSTLEAALVMLGSTKIPGQIPICGAGQQKGQRDLAVSASANLGQEDYFLLVSSFFIGHFLRWGSIPQPANQAQYEWRPHPDLLAESLTGCKMIPGFSSVPSMIYISFYLKTTLLKDDEQVCL